MPTPFCGVSDYPDLVQAQEDDQLLDHLYKYYPALNKAQLLDPMFRHWRRLVVVELLNRGLIKEDPGPGVPGSRPKRR